MVLKFEITIHCLICVQQGLFLSWDKYLCILNHWELFKLRGKIFLPNVRKAPPLQDQKISPKNVYVISSGCLINVQRCLFLLWEWSSFEGCPKIFKSLVGPQNYKQNDLRNADYSQSKNTHLWTSFKHPTETTWTFLGEIFLVLEGGAFLTFGKKMFLLSLKTSQWFEIH